MASSIRSHDGRALCVHDSGLNGEVVLLHHGTPGSGLLFDRRVAEAASRGLRLVSYSRPGYEGSTRLAGRCVADCVSDVRAVLDALSVERAYVAGWSGGGPHALACASLLPERVVAVGAIASAAPFGLEDLDFLEGMGEENIEEFSAAVAGPESLRSWMNANAATLSSVAGSDVTAALGDLVPAVDRAALTGDLGEFIAASFRAGLRDSYWGWYDDDLALVHDWGFDVDAVEVPVAIWQGAMDRMVPFAHGEWLAAHVADARAHLEPEHGHLSLTAGGFGAILDDLTSMTPRTEGGSSR